MDLLNFSVFSAGKLTAGAHETMSSLGETGDLSQEFSQMLNALRQSKLSTLEEPKLSAERTVLVDGGESNTDYQPLKNLIEFMDAVESQVGQGNSKNTTALPMREVLSALSDLRVFLKVLRQHLMGSNGSDKVETVSENAAIPVQISDKLDATDLAEFEQILNDLGQLLLSSNALDDQSEDRGNLDQAFPVNIKPAAVNAELLMAKEGPLELVTSVPSGGPILRDDMDASSHAELFQANLESAGAKPKAVLIERRSDTSGKKVVPENVQPALQNGNPHDAQTAQSDESKQVIDFDKASNKVKLPQEVEAKDRSVLAEALAHLRELLSKLQSQKPDQPFKLSQREQSKLVEATRLLRSIDFKDIRAGTNPFMGIFDVSKLVRQNDNRIVHPLNKEITDEDQLQSAKETDLNDLQTLEARLQSALASAPSNQKSSQIKRTSFVAFPPEISEKSITFEMPVFLVVNEEGASNPKVSHVTTSEVGNATNIKLETDEILTLPQKFAAPDTFAAKSETGTANSSDQARYDRPIVQYATAQATKPEMVRSEAKDVPAQNVTQSKAQKTEIRTAATTKINLHKAENTSKLQANNAENDINESLIAKKHAVVENLSSREKINRLASENQTFEIPQPKVKLSVQRPDELPKPQTITDFSARAVEAMVSQNLANNRKTASEMSSTAPFVFLNAETGTVQQASSASNPQNAGEQMQSGSDRLEKWIDGRLDLTSRGWVNNLAKTMASAINRGQQRLMLALSPPSLGRINIVFSARSVGLDVRIHAERKATLSLLGDAQAKLVSNLENAGHKVNNLSYAEMGTSENNFDLDYNQSAKGGKDDTGQRDPAEQKTVGDAEQVAQEKPADNNTDDASLVNITV